jgi:hypothetical protein
VHDDELSKRDRKDRELSVDSYPVQICLPITFIGPARIGSTHTIVSFLSQFSTIGIISASMSALDDLAFIHLQLSVAGRRHSDIQDMNLQLAEPASWPTNPSEAISHILRMLKLSSRESPAYVYTTDVSGRVGDYQTLVGPVLECAMPDRRKRIAIWFSWQTEGAGQEQATPLVELFDSFSVLEFGARESGPARIDMPNVEYLICRDIGNSVFRGRGKFSIPEADMLAMFDGNGVESAAVKLCMSLEDTWKASLRRRGVRGVSELALSWREWWLGHWASPI